MNQVFEPCSIGPLVLKNRAGYIKQHVDIPVIVVGGIRRLEDIKTAVSDRGIDCVSMSRPFIIEPDIVNRFQQGRERSRCINCGYCLIGVTASRLRCYYGRIPASIINNRRGG